MIFWRNEGNGDYLVSLGHVSLIEPLNTVIYAFHMPLFFFIFGYLFFSSKKRTLCQLQAGIFADALLLNGEA